MNTYRLFLRKVHFFLIIFAIVMLATTSYAGGIGWHYPQHTKYSHPCDQPRAMDQYYDVVREAAPGLPGWTVYRPANLLFGIRCKLPVVIWSNGACTETNDGVFYFLMQVAAHGFVVVAFGEPDVHVGGNGKAEADRMTSAIDWATSPPGHGGPWYFYRLDATKIATAGFSCGGVDAEYTACTDPRVMTSVIMCSGFFPDLEPGQNPSMSGPLAHSRALLPDLYGPVIFIPGGSEPFPDGDMAFPNAAANYDLVTTVPTVLAYRANTSHGGYFGSASTSIQLQAVQAVVQWLDGILNGNMEALEWVIGPEGLSSETDWTVESKGF
jgi:hypothetical protein